MTIDHLKREIKVADDQLNIAVEEVDIINLAPHFDDVDNYEFSLLDLPSQRIDVKKRAFEHGNEAGMKVALNFWRNSNPLKATFGALLIILLALHKGVLATKVCQYIFNKREFKAIIHNYVVQ